jgi:molecular chaperone HtpG
MPHRARSSAASRFGWCSDSAATGYARRGHAWRSRAPADTPASWRQRRRASMRLAPSPTGMWPTTSRSALSETSIRGYDTPYKRGATGLREGCMTHLDLPSMAEQAASRASNHTAFAGLSLPSVRSDLAQLLPLIRANSIFEEYTKHDISHIDRMLKLLDWIIPAGTREIMTSADWLLIVLGTYFHDLGMLVTRDEYDRRNSTHFAEFRARILAAEDNTTQDYVARVNDLPGDEAEKFLYQEYVRQNHAARIRAWIEGKPNMLLGITDAVAAEVARILSPLSRVFVEDLAIVCESHHLSDLDNTRKYRISRPYGSTDQETANVQYAAVLLRTIDILDITGDRAPSVEFRIINPRDPVSQREWAKQASVRNVRPKISEDEEGNLNPSLPRDAIEVHAKFDDAEGYFGLTSYLAYAEAQMRESFNWVAQSSRKLGSLYSFPWRSIDMTNIEAEGFIPQPFKFTLNQEKILQLLTGHTLYNESSVVIRELLQNSIDAVRLQHGQSASRTGEITLHWDSGKQMLEIRDNGTGMTQDIIEQNFLSVGSSYYQTQRFRDQNPSFNPISRFGIGVLTTFMVADQVEVITCHPEEADARKLELRTVLGQYLIRLLNKTSDPEALQVGPHGTLVRLYLRPTAKLDHVVEHAKRWILVPPCEVSAIVDGGGPIAIGHKSVGDALKEVIRTPEADDDPEYEIDLGPIRVVELESNGVSLAYALRWSKFFQEWEFAYMEAGETWEKTCTCVEGVRVQTGTPGFTLDPRSYTRPILAIANITGSGAPRTNVARSAFEQTAEYQRNLYETYLLYSRHVKDELKEMQEERKQSLTWAASEAAYLAAPLSPRFGAVSTQELNRALKTIPLFLLEEEGVREAVSAEQLAQREFFWTIDGALPSHIEYLLREIPEPVSLTMLLKGLKSSGGDLPDGPLMCSRPQGYMYEELISSDWQIADLRGKEERRRFEARWVKSGADVAWSSEALFKNEAWMRITEMVYELARAVNLQRAYGWGRGRTIRIPIRGVSASGFDSRYSAVSFGGTTYLLPGTRWASIVKMREGDLPLEERESTDAAFRSLAAVLLCNSVPLKFFQERLLENIRRIDSLESIDISKYIELRQEVEWLVYDTRQWRRYESQDF